MAASSPADETLIMSPSSLSLAGGAGGGAGGAGNVGGYQNSGNGSQQYGGLSTSPPAGGPPQIVPVAFEEGTLRALCDLDCGFPLLMDRIKQSMASCRETSVFLKKRAQIEDDYGRAMQKLARERMEAYSLSDGKAGSFVTAFQALVRAHDILADNRVKMASQLNEMADQLVETAREVERSRKTAKELGTRLERNLTDSENQTEKSRGRFDLAVEDLERILLSKAGENARDVNNSPHEMANQASMNPGSSQTAGKRTLGKAIGKLKGGPKNPAQVQRMEEEARAKMNSMSDAYRGQVISTQTIRQEYFNLQLPRMLKSLKESLDEVDTGTQFHLERYAFLFESMLLNDAVTVSPPNAVNPSNGQSIDEGPGLKSIAESIDNKDDFKSFMQNYAVSFAASGQKVLRREGPPEEGFVKTPRGLNAVSPPNGTANLSAYPYPAASSTSYPASQATSYASAQQPSPYPQGQGQHGSSPNYFGVSLGDQMQRDGVEIPRVLEKCAETIEMYGLDVTGIYRLSGTTSRIQRLKAKLEANVEAVDLQSDENLTDINDITGVLKLFFRELPEPLLTYDLYQGFIDAAKIENGRLRHIRLHERINELPDANYATCKYFLGHLDKVRQHESNNSMSRSNLAIVFGPTLLGPPPEEAAAVLQDMQWQCKAIETILEHYAEIFIDADEEIQQPASDSISPLADGDDDASRQLS